MFIKVTVNKNPKEQVTINTDYIKFMYPINNGEYRTRIRMDDNCGFYDVVEDLKKLESMLKKKGIL